MTKIERENTATILRHDGVVKLIRVERRGVVGFQVVVPGQLGGGPIGYPFRTEADALPFYARCVKFFRTHNS